MKNTKKKENKIKNAKSQKEKKLDTSCISAPQINNSNQNDNEEPDSLASRVEKLFLNASYVSKQNSDIPDVSLHNKIFELQKHANIQIDVVPNKKNSFRGINLFF